MSRTRFLAARLLPDADTSFAPGAVVVEEGRVAWAGPADGAPAADRTVDCGDATLVPGLVNAHVHLDLTHLRGRVPYDDDFAVWLEAVARRRGDGDRRAAAVAGLREAVARGTTTFGDVCAPDSFHDVVAALADTRVRARLFVEAIGFRPDRADRVFERVWELAEMRPLPPRVASGLSPHAPYSVSRELLAKLVAVADGHGRPLAIHVGETMEELALLRHGIGPLRTLLRRFDADDPAHEPHGSLGAFLAHLDLREAPLLLVHGNYLRPRDVPARASVAYCPVAHHFFGHPEHPVLELLEEGVRVALGSDSAASGESIDTLSETQFLARARLDLDARAVFRMATEWGARALGFPDAGRIEPGARADLAAFTPVAGPELLGLVDARCVLTVVDGEILHDAREEAAP